MFSLDNFYKIINLNLLVPHIIHNHLYFYPFGSTSLSDLRVVQSKPYGVTSLKTHVKNPNLVLFFDQEPLFYETTLEWYKDDFEYGALLELLNIKSVKLLANSDISDFTKSFCKEYGYYNWYYFFHGFAALDWYRDFQYIPPVFETHFTKVFISLNHLMTRKRSYRLNLVANYIEKKIIDQGVVSLPLRDVHGNIKQEIFDKNSLLSINAKKKIARHLINRTEPFVADVDNIQGDFSSKLKLQLEQSALWNVVSETIFYDKKLHLTEKIFKPIVACRPFILVGAVGNLAYLKKYGFKTFDRWVDESYDDIEDPDQRIEHITGELQRLCSMPMDELRIMEKEMRDVLEHNFNHFYGDFRKIIINELVDNFKNCMYQANNGEWREGKKFDIDAIDYDRLKKLLIN
jgi:hypothetical protein